TSPTSPASPPISTATARAWPSRPPPSTLCKDPRMPTLTTSLDEYEIWFLTGSQHLYGPETLAQVAEQSQVIADALNAAADVPVRIVWKPVLTDSAAIKRIALEANADDRVIGLIAWMHTF